MYQPDAQRAQQMLAWIEGGLRKVNAKRTEETLDDRSLYVGASDLAVANGCFRQAALNRMTFRYPSLADLLMFERGHFQEETFRRAIEANGYPTLKGLEIVFKTHMGNQCIYHLDVVLPTDEVVMVIEAKSNRDEVTKKPYESYNFQIEQQIAALSYFWDKPAFRLGTSGPLSSFPDLLLSIYGRRFPRLVEGWLLCGGFDEAGSFGPFFPEEQKLLVEGMALADALFEAEGQDPIKLRHARGLYPLCDYCAHMFGCPNLRGVSHEQYAEDLKNYLDKVAQKKELEESIETEKERFKRHYVAINPDGYVTTSVGSFKAQEQERTTIPAAKLEAGLAERNWSAQQIEQFIEKIANKSRYTKLLTRKPPKTPPKRKCKQIKE